MDTRIESNDWRFAVDYHGGTVWWDDRSCERWSEQIAWALRQLEVPEPGLVAIADYGTSPLSFLASSLTMPIPCGWAERLGNGCLCVDCSHQRLAVVPGLFGQLPVTTLIVRGQALLPLDDLCRRNGVVLEKTGVRVVVTLDGRLPPCAIRPGLDYLVVDEASLTIAPVCRTCGHAHLRRNYYEWVGGRVHNLAQDDLASWEAPDDAEPVAGGCDRGPADLRLAIPGLTGREVA